jgi:uncharacterized glyoxalase superfamily protein PhnB
LTSVPSVTYGVTSAAQSADPWFSEPDNWSHFSKTAGVIPGQNWLMTTNQFTEAAVATQQQTAPGAWPSLRYRDAEAALRYLVDVVGFSESVVHRGDAARPISHAELLWPSGGGIMFGSEPPDEPWSGGAGGPGTSTAYLSTDDVADVAARVTAAGWRVLRPLAETDYGSREFAFADPEGNAWSVGTYRGAQG